MWTRWNFESIFLKIVYQKGLFDAKKENPNFPYCRRILDIYWQWLLIPYSCFSTFLFILFVCFFTKGGMLHHALLWLAPACLGGRKINVTSIFVSLYFRAATTDLYPNWSRFTVTSFHGDFVPSTSHFVPKVNEAINVLFKIDISENSKIRNAWSVLNLRLRTS